MRTIRSVLPAIAFAALLARPAAADGPYAITNWTVDGGGLRWTQLGSVIIAGTIGQPDAALMAGRTQAIQGGFWFANGPVPLDVSPPLALPPAADAIFPARPNPFAGTTRISFALAASGPVDVRVFDVRGRLVRSLDSGVWAAGTYERAWSARDDRGRPLGPGVYLLRVRLPTRTQVQRLVVLN
jgi:hypothetical protein